MNRYRKRRDLVENRRSEKTDVLLAAATFQWDAYSIQDSSKVLALDYRCLSRLDRASTVSLWLHRGLGGQFQASFNVRGFHTTRRMVSACPMRSICSSSIKRHSLSLITSRPAKLASGTAVVF
jgi:hypothetical protein